MTGSREVSVGFTDDKTPPVQFIDKIVDIPGVAQRRAPMVQKNQKKIEIPQVQHIGKVVEFPAVQVGLQTVQKTAEIPVDVNVRIVTKRQVPAAQDSLNNADGAQVQLLDEIDDAHPAKKPTVWEGGGGGEGRGGVVSRLVLRPAWEENEG